MRSPAPGSPSNGCRFKVATRSPRASRTRWVASCAQCSTAPGAARMRAERPRRARGERVEVLAFLALASVACGRTAVVESGVTPIALANEDAAGEGAPRAESGVNAEC